MNYRSGVITGFVICGLIAATAGGAWYLLGKPIDATKPTPHPVQAEVKTVKEDAFNTIKLTADAEKRLAITIGTIERKPMKRFRSYGGEVTIPPGHTILVAAPLSGTLKSPTSGVPTPGRELKKAISSFNSSRCSLLMVGPA